MTDKEWKDFERRNLIYIRKEEAFGQADALYGYCFEADNGKVPQMTQAKNYVEHWAEMQQNHLGLLFWGLVGNGKTFAAACIANALIEKFADVKMTTLGAVLNKLPTMTAQDKEIYLKSLRSCDLLILDDFGMERQTDYAREQVFGIIDGRYLSGKPMIITTNLSLNEMKHPADITAQRIYDRILEMCVPVCFDGDSLREGRAKDNLKLYKQLMSE